MKTYKTEKWLNKQTSSSTGGVVCFDGFATRHGEKTRTTFLHINDCNLSARLHRAEDDTMEDFINKMKLLRDEIGKFINHLESNKAYEKENNP